MDQKICPATADMLNSAQGWTLTDIVLMLWRSRLLILIVTFLVIGLGVGSALTFAKYKSEGFFQFGGQIPMQLEKDKKDKKDKLFISGTGINIADYKRFSAAFSSADRFDQFMRDAEVTDGLETHNIQAALRGKDGITKLVEPVYTFTKLDAKELMDQPKENSNNIIGLRINSDGGTPQQAQNTVSLLGRYVVDSIIYLSYADILRFKHADLTAKNMQLDNQIIDLNVKLEELRRKGATLKKIVTRFPDAASQSARQVISVTEDSAKFLSPVTHLMSTEVQAAETNEEVVRAVREQKQTLLQLEYYDKVSRFMSAHKSGEVILRALEPIMVDVFKTKDLNDELVKEGYNFIRIDNGNAISLYLDKCRFIAGPTLPEKRSTRLAITLTVSLIAGLLLSMFIVAGKIWWSNNRERLI